MATSQSALKQLIEVEDGTSEAFELCSSKPDGQDLGMYDPKAASIEVTIGRHDFTIAQSPSLLNSDRSGGTTGAVAWRSCLLLASWLNESTNWFFASGLLFSGATVLELGSGSAGLISAVLAPRLGSNGRILASDMVYVTKLLRQNLTAHLQVLERQKTANIEVVSLDWEKDDAGSLLRTHGLQLGVNAIIACDCVYNYALIKPFLDTCKDVCCLGMADQSTKTYCIIVQQIRQPDVLEEWLDMAIKDFNVYRMPDELLPADLAITSGYVVHILVLKADAFC